MQSPPGVCENLPHGLQLVIKLTNDLVFEIKRISLNIILIMFCVISVVLSPPHRIPLQPLFSLQRFPSTFPFNLPLQPLPLNIPFILPFQPPLSTYPFKLPSNLPFNLPLQPSPQPSSQPFPFNLPPQPFPQLSPSILPFKHPLQPSPSSIPSNLPLQPSPLTSPFNLSLHLSSHRQYRFPSKSKLICVFLFFSFSFPVTQYHLFSTRYFPPSTASFPLQLAVPLATFILL